MTICFFVKGLKKVTRTDVDKIVNTDYGFRVYYSTKTQISLIDYEDVYKEEVESPIHIILD